MNDFDRRKSKREVHPRLSRPGGRGKDTRYVLQCNQPCATRIETAPSRWQRLVDGFLDERYSKHRSIRTRLEIGAWTDRRAERQARSLWTLRRSRYAVLETGVDHKP